MRKYYKIYMRNNCSCYTKNNRKCKNKKFHIINNNNFCYIHAQRQFYNHALIIQTSWITYKKNKKFQIYLKLPIDIQNKIKVTIHKDYFIKKLLKIFLNNKITYIKTFDNSIINIIENIDKLYNNYSYIFKYKFLIENSIIFDLINLANNTNRGCLGVISYIDEIYILYNQLVDQDKINKRQFYLDFTRELFEFKMWLSHY